MEHINANVENAQPRYTALYRIAGAGLLISVLFVLVDIGMSFGGGDVPTGTWGAAEWFAQFNQDPFLGLRNLGLFNVINLTVGIPLYLALYLLHKRSAPVLAVLALTLVMLGTAVYAANNRALAMLSLSSQYAEASVVEREVLVSAGTSILATAEDFTPGTFTGFFLSSSGSLLMMAAMLRGRLFGKRISLVGVAGSGALLIFTIAVTFAPHTFDAMMLLAMVGGLLMLGWNVAMALRMFRLGQADAPQSARTAAPVLR